MQTMLIKVPGIGCEMQETNFNGFKQAYDKLYRQQLWSHLQGIGISLELLGIV